MKSFLEKLHKGQQADMYSYRMLLVDNTIKLKMLKEKQELSDRITYVSVIATIQDPIFHIREKEYVKVFKSSLKEYARLNRTIRGDQVLSILAFATRGFENRVQFRLEAPVASSNLTVIMD